MSIRPTTRFLTRNDIIDPITPPPTVVTPMGGLAVPAGEFKPASWLPVAWKTNASKRWFSVSSGKVLSFDSEGRLVPSGYKKIASGAADVTDAFVTYTSEDVLARVRDIRTGSYVEAADVVTIAEAATALLSRGLVKEGDLTLVGDDFDAAELADCKAVLDAFISKPVGIAAYDFYVWGGDITDEEEGLNHHNNQMQHLVAFWTQVQMRMPVGGLSQTSGVDLAGGDAFGSAGTGSEFPDADGNGDVVMLTSTQLAALSRYSDSQKVSRYITAGSAVCGYALETDGTGAPLATNLSATPFVDANGVLLKEKFKVSDLRRAGDFMIDHEAGIVLVYSDWDTTGGTPADIDATSLSYYHYDGSGASSSWKGVSAIGNFKCGDYLTYDEFSNFIKSDTKDIGQVWSLIREPKGGLEKVKTGFHTGPDFDSTMTMPGTATAGLSDMLTLSQETVADTILICAVNFL